jgi:hypothetical protein
MNQAGNLNHGIGLTVPIAPAHILAAAELLDDDLLGPELIHNLPDHARSINHWSTDGGRAAFCRQQQYLGKDKLVARSAAASIDPNAIAFTDSKLMTTVLNDRVHPPTLLATAGHPLAYRLAPIGSIGLVRQLQGRTPLFC